MKILLISNVPTTWRDLQEEVRQVLEDCGQHAECNKSVSLVRGSVNVDVWAEDKSRNPKIVTIIECKYWAKPIPKTVVHALKTVLDDSGANIGIIVSKQGFQSGAIEAATFTPIMLLNWQEFSAMYIDEWLTNYFYPTLSATSDAFMEYTEPINSRIFNKADKLSEEKRNHFLDRREKYQFLSNFILKVRKPYRGINLKQSLSVRESIMQQDKTLVEYISDDLLDAPTIRDFFLASLKAINNAIDEFDCIFGGRA